MRSLDPASIEAMLAPAVLVLVGRGRILPQDEVVLAYLAAKTRGLGLADQPTARTRLAEVIAALQAPDGSAHLAARAAALPKDRKLTAFELAADALDSCGVAVADRVASLSAMADRIGLDTTEVTRLMFSAGRG